MPLSTHAGVPYLYGPLNREGLSRLKVQIVLRTLQKAYF